jgi:hypothetical protein
MRPAPRWRASSSADCGVNAGHVRALLDGSEASLYTPRMAFDDLARHMASRDGKKKLAAHAGNADQIVADAAKAHRRMSRTRDLILGPILLVGGAIILVLYLLYILEATDGAPRPERPSGDNLILYSSGLLAVAAGMTISGVVQLVRGLRNRSR